MNNTYKKSFRNDLDFDNVTTNQATDGKWKLCQPLFPFFNCSKFFKKHTGQNKNTKINSKNDQNGPNGPNVGLDGPNAGAKTHIGHGPAQVKNKNRAGKSASSLRRYTSDRMTTGSVKPVISIRRKDSIYSQPAYEDEHIQIKVLSKNGNGNGTEMNDENQTLKRKKRTRARSKDNDLDHSDDQELNDDVNYQGRKVTDILRNMKNERENRDREMRQSQDDDLIIDMAKTQPEEAIYANVPFEREDNFGLTSSQLDTLGNINFTTAWKKQANLADIYKAGILDKDRVLSLLDPNSSDPSSDPTLLEEIHTSINNNDPIAGILTSSGETISIFSAAKCGLIRNGTAVALLEAQAATGCIINPNTGEKLTPKEAKHRVLTGRGGECGLKL